MIIFLITLRHKMNLKESGHVIYDILLFIGMGTVYFIEAIVLTLVPRRYRAKSIQNEIALVTGGASGIGKLITIKLAKLGAHVVVWDINKNGKKLHFPNEYLF